MLSAVVPGFLPTTSANPVILGKEVTFTDTFLAAGEAEAGMAEMSEKFREKGGEIYLPAGE